MQELALDPRCRWQDEGMKLTVSIPDADVQFIDGYAESAGYASRSAVVYKAVRLLRASELGADYEQAWTEWATTGEQHVWESSTGGGADT